MSSATSSRESSSEPQQRLESPDTNAREQGAAESADASSQRYLKACDNCRRRKVKCNGERPSCGHCTRVEAPCHYSIKPKSRRMWKCLENAPCMMPGAGNPAETATAAAAAAASAVAPGGGAMASGPSSCHILTNENKSGLDDATARLIARVETMERLLMQRNGVNPQRSGQQGPMAPVADDYAHQGAFASGSMSSYAAATSSVATSHRNSLAGIMSELDPTRGAAAAVGMVGSSAGHLQQSVPAKRDFHSITPDNASNGYRTSTVSVPGSLSSPFIGCSTVAVNSGQQTIGQQQKQHEQQPPPPPHQKQQSYSFDALSHETIIDLIDTLFSTNIHITDILHEDTFRKQFAAGTLSPLLLYSALASAARYSKNPAVSTDPPYSASAPFIARAKALVVDAIEEPSLGNAQGLMILCMMHFSLGNEVVTTFYKALALNMCILLGFNRLDSVNGPVHPHNNCGHELMSTTAMSLSWVEREAARRLWWLIFTIENYSSTCMGLAPSIQAEYCDVDLPASALEWTKGMPQEELDALAGTAESAPKRARTTKGPLQLLSAYHAQLSLIFSKVAWLVTHTNANTDDAVQQFADLNSTLQRWYESLPKELRISSVDTLLYGSHDSAEYYQICILHMRFYMTVIQLNHAIPEFTEDATVIESGQRKCVIAASRVSDLLRSSFEIPVDMREMNWYMCVFRAAHVHIYRLLSRDSESIARAKQDLAIHRRHLREGGPLWRICYKLLNRLDDMEQMVMLLPAQIPVAELIRLKSLTKNGKSQLVNMQLDALIKPSLIQSEHGDSEDLPLMARASLARRLSGNQVAQASAAQIGIGGSQGIGYSAPITGAGIYGLLDHTTNGVADISAINSLNTPSLGSSAQVPTGLSVNNTDSSNGSINGGSLSLMTPSPSSLSPSLTLPSIVGQPNNTAAIQQHNRQSDLQFAQDNAPINTNIVIDNNMAETLVNYFYMVASNPPNGDAAVKQQANGTQGGSGPQSQGDDGSTNNSLGTSGSVAGILASPTQTQNMLLWPDGTTGGANDASGSAASSINRAQTLPSAASMLAAQQQSHLSPQLDSLVQMKGGDSSDARAPGQSTLLGQLFAPQGLSQQLKDDRQTFM
ncbi:hypothetical protein EV175_003157 [Coemansia sp. RSA 1933]|nr:hypothetical protein EV175_003157 [Coemansia sp. RSA 1933]